MGKLKNNYSNFLVESFSITQKFQTTQNFQIPIRHKFLNFEFSSIEPFVRFSNFIIFGLLNFKNIEIRI